MKQELIDKTYVIVEKKGIEHVSMRDLAKTMGFSTMATYRHFESKDHLLLEVAAKGFNQLTLEGDKLAAKEKTPQKKLEAVLMSYYMFGQNHKNLFELMFGPIKKKEKLSENFQKSSTNSLLNLNSYVEDFLGPKVGKDHFKMQSTARILSFVHGMTVLISNGFLSAQQSSAREMQDKVRKQILDTLENLK